jgi:uncharacterized LabA/DUF88 family protein
MPDTENRPITYAFVDSQNLNLGTQRMGWKLDWRKFRHFLEDNFGVSKAYLFIGYMSDNESLYEYMHELGYLVVLKPTVDVSSSNAAKRPDEQDDTAEKEKPIVKGNVDTELVLYVMKEMPNYDQAVIVTGDGDFFTLAEYLEERGKLAAIVAPNWRYSSLLKPFEEKITRLDKLRRQLAYHDRKKPKSNRSKS